MKNFQLGKKQLRRAHEIFMKKEPRDLFYRVATELVNLAINKKASLTLSEAIAVLLQTWNAAFYRFHKFDNKHFSDIDRLIKRHKIELLAFGKQKITQLKEKDKQILLKIFSDFEKVLYPVGAAKALHLLAPKFFPLWDRHIAQRYRVSLGKRGKNAEKYWRFMEITKKQVEQLGEIKRLEFNPLKVLDEYNYCKYTKKWI